MNNNFIVDNNTYILSKNKNHDDVTNKQIQDIVFKILLEIDRICRKNNIPYALSFGSALGLNNYGGFIPWDDDGDVAIKYEDYDRFVEALKNDLSEDFTFECFEVDNRAAVIIPPIKVRYKHSLIVEKNNITIPNLTKRGNGLFVDVCPFMGVPEDEKEHRRIIHKCKLKMPLYVFLEGFLHINPLKMKQKLKKFEKEMAEKYKDSNYVSQTVIIPFQEYPKKMVHSLAFPKDIIYPFVEYEFNGVKLFSFHKVEEFCKLRYGEQSLKRWENGQYVEPYHKRKSNHLRRVDIYK